MIVTDLTEAFRLQHPIVLAPMGGASGGRLAAAVSNAGGLGLVGGGYGDREWLSCELALAKAQTTRPWGVGLITWSIGPGILELALGARPDAFMLSFGDPRPHAKAIKSAGCRLICQVQGLDEARLAREAGADFIVAQGTEAGGHGGSRGTLPLVPAIVDFVAPIPVIAAGGIVDGRGLAAALMLGAHGALLGTRFCASAEALGRDGAKQRLVAAHGGETARTRVFDIVRDYRWPATVHGPRAAQPLPDPLDRSRGRVGHRARKRAPGVSQSGRRRGLRHRAGVGGRGRRSHYQCRACGSARRAHWYRRRGAGPRGCAPSPIARQ